ncbi:MAG: hypothetical protein ACKOED_04500 [Aestuariivirga sp.]|uniref:hypothetical protein n=1 Tax=Aestuariivirga sp. TaxID=2650926 RepID=UPI0038D04670
MDAVLPVTSEKIKAACTNSTDKGARRFVIVAQEDSWIAASDLRVAKALEESLARLEH